MANSTEEMPATSAEKIADSTALHELSFPSLSAVMSHYLQVTEQSGARPVERWSSIIGLIGAGFGILSGALLDVRQRSSVQRPGLRLNSSALWCPPAYDPLSHSAMSALDTTSVASAETASI